LHVLDRRLVKECAVFEALDSSTQSQLHCLDVICVSSDVGVVAMRNLNCGAQLLETKLYIL
jgi:hypothetical protein